MTTLVTRLCDIIASVFGLLGLVFAVGAAWQLFGLATAPSPTTLTEFVTWGSLTAVAGAFAWAIDSVAQWTEG